MMSPTLIVPMAGKSLRLFQGKPKWMMTHPKTKNFLGIESILGLKGGFKNIIFVTLREYEKEYHFLKGFEKCLENNNLDSISHIYLLNQPTASQSETVNRAIKKFKITGPIVVKDADNFFELEINEFNNFVAIEKLENIGFTNPSNKSYISLDNNNLITNIIEKKVISNTFSGGAYGFSDAKIFSKYFNKLQKEFSYVPVSELYISYLIFNMILDGGAFETKQVKNYKDWGDQKSWDTYKKSYSTIFCDIDGTLIENSSENFPPYIGDGKPLIENIENIRNLKESGSQIILTTSRPEKYRSITKKELKKHLIPYDYLIMGLLHGKRILINDYSQSNKFPSAESLNIFRNTGKISHFFD